MTDVFRGAVCALVGAGTIDAATASFANSILGTFKPDFFGTQTINSSGYKNTTSRRRNIKF